MAGLMLTFRANPAHLAEVTPTITQPGLGEKLGEKLGRTRTAMVKAMRKNPKVTAAKLAESLKLSTTRLSR